MKVRNIDNDWLLKIWNGQDCNAEGSIHAGVSSTKGSWEKVDLLTHIWNTEEIRVTQLCGYSMGGCSCVKIWTGGTKKWSSCNHLLWNIGSIAIGEVEKREVSSSSI